MGPAFPPGPLFQSLLEDILQPVLSTDAGAPATPQCARMKMQSVNQKGPMALHAMPERQAGIHQAVDQGNID